MRKENEINKKEITKIVKRFHCQMQKIVDNSNSITKITMQIEDKSPVIIAEKTQKKDKP